MASEVSKTECARVVPALVKARSLAQHELSTVESLLPIRRGQRLARREKKLARREKSRWAAKARVNGPELRNQLSGRF
jgi:hypothetical protein